jgi:tetratricopeptide (TPR) repeat protein
MNSPIQALAAKDIRTQVDRVLGSSELAKSQRLQDFLNHITEEFLAGRADRIKGLSIAQAVFSAGKSFDAEANSIVRVEAGRLRRRLAEYYTSAGRDDPIIVDIPKGAYVPRFTQNPEISALNKSSQPDHRPGTALTGRWQLFGLVVLVVLLVSSWLYFGARDQSVTGEMNRNKIPEPFKSSEAEILFQQSYMLMMPPQNLARLISSRQLFQRVIEMDSTFVGGYAGKSITFSFQVIFIKSENITDDLRQALTLAERAVEVDPESQLGHAVLALALALNAKTDNALDHVQYVIADLPHEEYASAIAATSLIICGEPSKAIDLLSYALKINPSETRTPYLNLLGIAQYVKGDFTEAAESLELNQVRGGPKGPHMDVFLAASYAQMGKDFEAQAIIKKLQRINPKYPVEAWLSNFIKSDVMLQETMNKLYSLGLAKS